ncbi:hypothetical protein I8752_00490 [Nostocaceae cyanobacterium CENA369]|uniref:Uncharacterized protein n=1 Tax=Dendronalium phyllosphericum CENA369 TaxID=1725256 RepID=A0A8J7LC20_9NOST|nr:hypothetical protein [Dendronalium phyllosphericum]MBH8571526.1 hypothetical protein [Dendronalium phyllosphericum CENA369]
MINSQQLTILVNSTDSFEDCWQPFFTLFSIYWPNCPYPIVLNTETKSFSYPGLNIQCSQVGANESGKRLNWSDCLIRCIDKIHSKYIFYLQEDYFLNDYVNASLIDDFLQIMENEGYSHIRLRESIANSPHKPSSKYPLLWKISQKSNYRIGLQAGLWVKDRLRFYLKPNETGWEFERWGNRRAQKINDSFYCQNLDYFNRQNRYIFPYYPTGIVKGKWFKPAVVDLFKQHKIEVDFSNRGFYELDKIQNLVQLLRSKIRKIFMLYIP